MVSRQQLDDATAKFESDQQRVNSLEKAFQLMKIGPRAEEIARAQGALTQAQGQLDYAQSQLDATVIRAPVTGTILDRTAEKGELITAQFASAAAGGPQGSVVSLADLNDLQVELDIAQADFARLSPTQKAKVTTDAYPDKEYDGEIAQISPEANRQKATVQVKVQVLNPDKYPTIQLRPEMNATVVPGRRAPKTEKTAQEPTGVYVPSTAIRDRDGKKIVFLALQRQGRCARSARTQPAQRWSAGRRSGRRRKRHHHRAGNAERRRQNQNQRSILGSLKKNEILRRGNHEHSCRTERIHQRKGSTGSRGQQSFQARCLSGDGARRRFDRHRRVNFSRSWGRQGFFERNAPVGNTE